MAEQVILKAAMEVIAEATIGGVRMRLVAERSGMSQANLHYYYKTKYELLMAVLAELQRQFAQERAERKKFHANGLKENLNLFTEQKKEIILNQPVYDFVQFNYWTYACFDEKVRDIMFQLNEEWRSAMRETIHEYAPAVSEEHLQMLSYMMVSMLMGVSIQYLHRPGSIDLDEYFELCENMLVDQITKFEKLDIEKAGGK